MPRVMSGSSATAHGLRTLTRSCVPGICSSWAMPATLRLRRPGRAVASAPMRDLELDLEVFSGPFDLLLARMLEARRYRSAAAYLRELLEGEEGVRYRSAPPPKWARRTSLDDLEAVYDPARLGVALGGLLREPPRIDLGHVTIAKVSVADRLTVLRSLLRRGVVSFDEAVQGADRVTVAVTLWALLEMYKRGEATWEQAE